MEINEDFLLLGALENVLGKGKKTARTNYSWRCPFCGHAKRKLEIDIHTDENGYNRWACWVCGTKGRTIRSLLKHLNLSRVEAESVLQFVKKGEHVDYVPQTNIVRLPEEFQPLEKASYTSLYANKVRSYLMNRGLTEIDFIRYGIGYCMTGQYKDRVIIPSYNENNQLNYFIARSLDDRAFAKYVYPEAKKDLIIPFENLICWNQPIILVEGVFDMFAIRRNCICLLGKFISSALMKKIIENPVPEIYIALDKDAAKQALKHCETFLNMGKKVYFVKPSDKDPSEEGFRKFTEQLQQAKELTFSDLINYKLNLV